MLHLDMAVLDWIQVHLSGTLLDAVMPFVSALGNGGVVWIILALVLLLSPKHRETGIAIAAALALEVICCNLVLKPLVGRIRPCDVNTAVQLLIPRPTDFSFPSGHTGAAFAAAGALFFRRNRLWLPVSILAVLIAFSRLYLYVHYPTDVLAGALLGIMAGWMGVMLSKQLRKVFHAL